MNGCVQYEPGTSRATRRSVDNYATLGRSTVITQKYSCITSAMFRWTNIAVGAGARPLRSSSDPAPAVRRAVCFENRRSAQVSLGRFDPIESAIHDRLRSFIEESRANSNWRARATCGVAPGRCFSAPGRPER